MIAGVPPDGFSATGQVWGNPLYNWPKHKEMGYDWWIRRIAKCKELYDVIRIDHFRGFDEYFAIPADSDTAASGHWEKGPGTDLFDAIRDKLGETPIIAEDLGYVTETVRQLVRDTGFPNMKVLEFAFDSRDSSGAMEYLPYRYQRNCVVYTGTHDNETLRGWIDSILPVERKQVCEYLDVRTEDPQEIVEKMIIAAFSSVADYCIIPLQDYLGLDNSARINQPSTNGKNWKWRVDKKDLSEQLIKRIAALTALYGRKPEQA
jgi:4-alpha-glucanotransferase